LTDFSLPKAVRQRLFAGDGLCRPQAAQPVTSKYERAAAGGKHEKKKRRHPEYIPKSHVFVRNSSFAPKVYQFVSTRPLHMRLRMLY